MFSHNKESPESQELRSSISASATTHSKANNMRTTQVKHKAYPPKIPSGCPVKEATWKDELRT